MAVKASESITLFHNIDIISTTYYYKLVSQLSAPNVPDNSVVDPTSDGWSTAEPTYTEGSTSYLYYTIQTKFSNGTQAYSYANIISGNRKACLSSSYEAAKSAYNKAQAVKQEVDGMSYIGENLILYSKGDEQKGFFKNSIEENDELVFDFVLPASSGDNWAYKSINIIDGFKLNIDEYEAGKEYTWSYDIKYLIYENIDQKSEWWMGQRYTNQYTTVNWQAITQISLPDPIFDNNILNTEWQSKVQKITIPSTYPQPNVNEYVLLTSQPEDWSTSYIGYYTKDGNNYIPITSQIAPAWAANTYYNLIIHAPSNAANIRIGYKASNAAHIKIQLRNIKLEKGSRATDWSKSSEEIDNNINDSYNDGKKYADEILKNYEDNTASKKYYEVSKFDADMELRDGNLKTQWDVDISNAVKDGDKAYNYVIKKLRPYIKQSLDTSFILLEQQPSDWATKYSTDYWMLDEYDDYIRIPEQDTPPTFVAGKYYSIDPNSTFKPLLTLGTGEENSCKIIISNDYIKMVKGNDELTNWTVNDINVNNVNANNTVKIGPFVWSYNSNDGLSLKKVS